MATDISHLLASLDDDKDPNAFTRDMLRTRNFGNWALLKFEISKVQLLTLSADQKEAMIIDYFFEQICRRIDFLEGKIRASVPAGQRMKPEFNEFNSLIAADLDSIRSFIERIVPYFFSAGGAVFPNSNDEISLLAHRFYYWFIDATREEDEEPEFAEIYEVSEKEHPQNLMKAILNHDDALFMLVMNLCAELWNMNSIDRGSDDDNSDNDPSPYIPELA